MQGLPPIVVAVSAGFFTSYAIAGANPRRTVSIGSVSITKGAGGSKLLTFPITLDGPAATNVRVSYATSDGTATQPSDYLAKTGSVLFSPGETAKTVSIRVYGDISVEPDETFSVTLTGVTTGFAVLGQADATGTITNDDAISTVSIISPAQLAEGRTSSQQLGFTVGLSQRATSTIKVAYATSDGTATAGSG